MHKVRQAIRKHRKLLSACAMVLAVALMFWAVNSPAIVGVSAAKRVLPIYSVQRDDRVVSLTFDAAWGNEDTQTLIDILGKYNVHATFFVVGEWVDKYPESVKALADAGNEVMNHSSTHPHMAQLSAEQIEAEVNTCADKIKAVTGTRPTLFRCPYGEYNDTVISAINALGMHAVQWDVDSLDWKAATRSPRACSRACSRAASCCFTTRPSTRRRRWPGSSRRSSPTVTRSYRSHRCSCPATRILTPTDGSVRQTPTQAHKPDNESGSCAPLSLHFARKNAIMKKKSLPYGSSGATYMENFQKIAVLIDADNTQLTKLEAVLHEVSTYGRIVVKKAYGNWRKDSLKNWESELKRLAIRAEQQFDYVTGKNTTDIAMVIGAMDLLHTNMYDALVLVSSDSDFTPLAIRLRESGLYIIGAGVTTTPESFKNACDDFILIDYLAKADDKPAVEHTAEPAAKKPAARKAKKTVRSTKKPATEPTPAAEPEPAPAPEPEPAPKKPDIREIHNLLHIASEKYQDADGFVNVSSSGLYIKRVKPDFNVRAYGYSKLPELLAAFPNKYQIKRYEGKGGATIIAYKCL